MVLYESNLTKQIERIGMSWISNDKVTADWMYNLNINDTFTVVYGDKLELTEYATVTGGPYHERKNYYDSGFAEPYDVIIEVDLRKDPSSDFTDDCCISYNPDDEELFVKRGVGRFESVKSICTNALDADYESDRQLVAECEECGTKTQINVNDNGSVNSNSMKKNSNGDIVTPCCSTDNWSTKLND